MRATAAAVFDRSRNLASMADHFIAAPGEHVRTQPSELDDVPTLVMHGTADPLFPLAHGRALAHEIPGAYLIELDGVGHQLPPPQIWDLVVDELIAISGPHADW